MIARLPFDRSVSDAYAFLAALLYKASAYQCRVGEVPVIFIERAYYFSVVSVRVLAESLAVPWKIVMSRKPPDHENEPADS